MKIQIGINDINYMVAESVKKVLKEGNFDFLNNGEFKWNKNYESYVLVDDSDDSFIENYTSEMGYDAKQDAINDANEMKKTNRLGSYSVFGCVNDVYDENTLVYCTNNSRNELKF